MAPKRKNHSEKGSSKTIKQRRFSERVIGKMELHDKNKSIVGIPKNQQTQSQRKDKKKYAANDNSQNQLDSIIEEDISKENPKSMSIDSNDINSDDQESSSSDSCCSNTSNINIQGKTSSSTGHFNIHDDDDDTDEFKAMFMSNARASNTRPSYSSTPLVRSQNHSRSAICATGESSFSQQIINETRSPLSTNNIGHQITASNTYSRNLNTPINPRVRTNSLPLSQVSSGNQSLSSINYTTNNSAVLETFVEYRTLKRELQRALKLNETWKADYQVLVRRMQQLENNSFPRPNTDGRLFLEQLLDSLRTSEHDDDNRSTTQLANDIGLPETTLLSFSNAEPQKTALKIFGALFATHQERDSLVNVVNMNLKHPTLLNDILVFARRCAPGSGYSMGMLKEAIGNSIRCARHKIKTDQALLFAVQAVQNVE